MYFIEMTLAVNHGNKLFFIVIVIVIVILQNNAYSTDYSLMSILHQYMKNQTL